MRSVRFGSMSCYALLIGALLGALAPGRADARARIELPDDGPVSVRAVIQKTVVHPGDQVAVAVVMDHQAGFHSWPAQDVLPPDVASVVESLRTHFGIGDPRPSWIGSVAGVQYPEPHKGRVADPNGGSPIEVPLYSGTAIGYILITVAMDAPVG